MNTRTDTANLPTAQRDSASAPAGAGLALAVTIGSLIWVGIFALMM
mgnify:CR=1 FL=1